MSKSDDPRYERSGMKWTKAELELLVKSDLSDAELAKKLHRTEKTVSMRRKTARREAVGSKDKVRWTPEEIELAYNSTYGEDEELAKKLGRTVSAVQTMRRKERVRRGDKLIRKPWSYQELQLLETDLTDEEISEKTGRSMSSIYAKRYANGGKYTRGRLYEPYTTKEIADILHTEYGNAPKLAAKYQRTVSAIVNFRYKWRKEHGL